MAATDVDRSRAEAIAWRRGWNTKAAIVMLKCGVGVDEANLRLDTAKGWVGRAIA